MTLKEPPDVQNSFKASISTKLDISGDEKFFCKVPPACKGIIRQISMILIPRHEEYECLAAHNLFTAMNKHNQHNLFEHPIAICLLRTSRFFYLFSLPFATKNRRPDAVDDDYSTRCLTIILK